MFFVFMAFECFYSAGVQDLMIKTIREFYSRGVFSSKACKAHSAKSIQKCLFMFIFILFPACGLLTFAYLISEFTSSAMLAWYVKFDFDIWLIAKPRRSILIRTPTPAAKPASERWSCRLNS